VKFIKLYESALFFIVCWCKITYKCDVFWRDSWGNRTSWSCPQRKRANNTKYSIKKKQSDELNSIHLTAIFW